MALRSSKRGIDGRLVGEELADVYATYSPRLIGFLMRQVFDAQVAMDLTAETFAQMLLSRRRFRGDSEAELEAWIFAIARTQLARYQRKGYAERRALKRAGLQAPILADDDYERVDALAEIETYRSAIAAALSELTADQREAVQLRVVEQLPYETVAENLGVSEQTARARVSRALRALADSLDSNPIAQEMS
jgi:RNA polymerase sigma factor (sigma-70 family)